MVVTNNYPVYGIIIVLSVLIGLLYIYKNLIKEGLNKNIVFLYIFMLSSFIFTFSIAYHMIETNNYSFKNIGLSSIGAGLGAVLSSIIFNFIVPNKKTIKYTILALPLIYGLSKIGCFFAGCCFGIPYNGLFKVKYPSRLDEFLFPVQLLETIVFIIIFTIVNKLKNNENIICYTIFICAVSKFLLDYLRYDHVLKSITSNQIVCLIIIILLIINMIIKKVRTK